jgi:hypothetical protein
MRLLSSNKPAGTPKVGTALRFRRCIRLIYVSHERVAGADHQISYGVTMTLVLSLAVGDLLSCRLRDHCLDLRLSTGCHPRLAPCPHRR